MKKLSFIAYSFIIALSVTLSSCGSDKSLSTATVSGKNGLTGECACNTVYFPVCDNNNITYDNSCIASCYKVTQVVNGNCIPRYDLSVCARNKYTGAIRSMSEGEAVNDTEYGRAQITGYSKTCN